MYGSSHNSDIRSSSSDGPERRRAATTIPTIATMTSGAVTIGFSANTHCSAFDLKTLIGYGGGNAASANGAFTPHSPIFQNASPTTTPVAADSSIQPSDRHVSRNEKRLVRKCSPADATSTSTKMASVVGCSRRAITRAWWRGLVRPSGPPDSAAR